MQYATQGRTMGVVYSLLLCGFLSLTHSPNSMAEPPNTVPGAFRSEQAHHTPTAEQLAYRAERAAEKELKRALLTERAAANAAVRRQRRLYRNAMEMQRKNFERSIGGFAHSELLRQAYNGTHFPQPQPGCSSRRILW